MTKREVLTNILVLDQHTLNRLKEFKKNNEKLFKHAIFNNKSNKAYISAINFFAAFFSNDYETAAKLKDYISTDVINAYLINSNSVLFHAIKQGLDSRFCSLFLDMGIELEDGFYSKALLQLSPSKIKDLAILKVILNDKYMNFSTEGFLPALFTGQLQIKSIQDKELFIPLLLSAGCRTTFMDVTTTPIINYCASERLKLCKLWLELGGAIEALEAYAKSEKDESVQAKIQILTKDLRREIISIVETRTTKKFEEVLHRFDKDNILGERSPLKIALINIGLCIAGLGVFYVAAGMVNMALTGGRHFLFFNQSEGQKIQEAIQIKAESIRDYEPG